LVRPVQIRFEDFPFPAGQAEGMLAGGGVLPDRDRADAPACASCAG